MEAYKHLIERFSTGIAIEEGVVLDSKSIDSKGRDLSRIGRTFHGRILYDELGLAGVDMKFPDASIGRVCSKDKVVAFPDMSHAIQLAIYAAKLFDDWCSEDCTIR